MKGTYLCKNLGIKEREGILARDYGKIFQMEMVYKKTRRERGNGRGERGGRDKDEGGTSEEWMREEGTC